MPPIRNFCVARGRLSAAGTTLIYTVPASNALILKSLLLNNVAGTAANFYWYLLDSGGTTVPRVHQGNAATNTPDLFETWLVLNTGDHLYINVDQQPVDYWVSGAVLPFVSGF